MTKSPLTPAELAQTIDHTLLKADATRAQIEKLCAEAADYNFASVCVNPTWVPLAADLLADTPPLVCTVIGFPLGATLPQAKASEAAYAVAQGAQEVDMVINIGALKDGDDELVGRDIAGVVRASGGATVKVIIETALLSDAEKIRACEISKSAGADFVKTSTGFSTAGATTADIALMRQTVGPEMGVKASGGVRSLADALAMLEAGATRLGASAGLKIVQEAAGDA